MTDSRNFPGGGNFQWKPNSKTQRSFFDEIDEQFEILYRTAVGKATGLTNERTAADGVTRKNTSCHEMHYEGE